MTLSPYTIGVEGDSFAKRCSLKQSSPYHRQINACGFIAPYSMLSGNIMAFALDWNKGVGGETTAEILARIGVWASSPCNVVVVSGGTNDADGLVPAATIIANRVAIRNALLSYGLTVIDMNIPRRTTWNSGAAAPRDAIVNDVNAGLAAIPGIMLLDAFAVTNGSPSTKLLDGIHLSQLGAYMVGQLLWNLLTPIYGESTYSVHPDAIISKTVNGIFTGDHSIEWNGAVTPGYKAFCEMEIDFPNFESSEPTGMYLELLQNGSAIAQGNMPLPIPGVPQIASPFALNAYRDFQIDYFGARLILRTPVASNIVNAPLVGVLRNPSGKRVRVFNEQIVVHA
jgi:hypothetical protein